MRKVVRPCSRSMDSTTVKNPEMTKNSLNHHATESMPNWPPSRLPFMGVIRTATAAAASPVRDRQDTPKRNRSGRNRSATSTVMAVMITMISGSISIVSIYPQGPKPHPRDG